MVQKEQADKYLRPKFARVSGSALRTMYNAPQIEGHGPINSVYRHTDWEMSFYNYPKRFSISFFHYRNKVVDLELDVLPVELSRLFDFKEIRGKTVTELSSLHFDDDTDNFTTWADIRYFPGKGRDSMRDRDFMYGNDPTEYDCPFFEAVFELLDKTIKL